MIADQHVPVLQGPFAGTARRVLHFLGIAADCQVGGRNPRIPVKKLSNGHNLVADDGNGERRPGVSLVRLRGGAGRCAVRDCRAAESAAIRGPVQKMPYESGMDPIHDTRRRFDVRFHLMAIAFLVFDVEVLFLYPWAVAAKRPDAARRAA